jgi:hypothetical protein
MECTRSITNNTFKQELLRDLPLDLINITTLSHHQHKLRPGERAPIDFASTLDLPAETVKQYLRLLIDRYHTSLTDGSISTAMKTADAAEGQKLLALSQFLRAFSWLRPFQKCNGRVRQVLMQRELRRLKLGCGATLYDTRHGDILLSSTVSYAEKIAEGLKLAIHANQTGTNPWTDPAVLKMHTAKFSMDRLTDSCLTNASS